MLCRLINFIVVVIVIVTEVVGNRYFRTHLPSCCTFRVIMIDTYLPNKAIRKNHTTDTRLNEKEQSLHLHKLKLLRMYQVSILHFVSTQLTIILPTAGVLCWRLGVVCEENLP